MAGRFIDMAYESDLGFTCKIRVSSAESAVMTASGSPIDAGFHCLNSGSRRTFGLHPRGARLSRTTGVGDDAKIRSTFLAYPTVAAYEAVALESSIVIGGIDWTVKSKVPETAV